MSYLIVFGVGVFVGVLFPRPQWAKNVYERIKEKVG